MNSTPVVPNGKYDKVQYQKARVENQKMLIEDIKRMLIQKGIAFERDMTSQEYVLFQVVFLLTGTDLTSQFTNRVLCQPSDSRMSSEEKLEVKRRREQYRRDKQEAAFEKLEHFLMSNRMGNANGIKMTRMQVLEATRTLVSTITSALPSSTPSPQAPPLNYGIDQILSPCTPQRPTGNSTQSSPGSSSGISSASTSPVLMNNSVPMFMGFPAVFNPFLNFNIAQGNGLMMSNLVGDSETAQMEEEDEEIDIVGL